MIDIEQPARDGSHFKVLWLNDNCASRRSRRAHIPLESEWVSIIIRKTLELHERPKFYSRVCTLYHPTGSEIERVDTFEEGTTQEVPVDRVNPACFATWSTAGCQTTFRRVM